MCLQNLLSSPFDDNQLIVTNSFLYDLISLAKHAGIKTLLTFKICQCQHHSRCTTTNKQTLQFNNKNLSLSGHVESQKTKKLCFCMASLALNFCVWTRLAMPKQSFLFSSDSTWPHVTRVYLLVVKFYRFLCPFLYF